MNKTIGIIGLSVLMVAVFAVFAAAVPSIGCSETDSGDDIWNAGITSDYNGPNPVDNADDCDGASENLMEFYCDGDIGKLENTKCTDFNAVCISDGDKNVGDYCACPDGYEFVNDFCVAPCVGCQCDNSCPTFCELHPSAPQCGSDVPEFSTVTLGLAIAGAGLGVVFLRRQH